VQKLTRIVSTSYPVGWRHSCSVIASFAVRIGFVAISTIMFSQDNSTIAYEINDFDNDDGRLLLYPMTKQTSLLRICLVYHNYKSLVRELSVTRTVYAQVNSPAALI
jgi:hypothetical protein